MSERDTDLKRLDASNRAVRTLAQGFLLDVTIAIVLVLSTSLGDANGWGDLEWSIMGFTIVKSVVHSLLSYIMRMKADLLPPPSPVAEPNVDVGAGGMSIQGLLSSPAEPHVPGMDPEETVTTLERLKRENGSEIVAAANRDIESDRDTFQLPEDYRLPDDA